MLSYAVTHQLILNGGILLRILQEPLNICGDPGIIDVGEPHLPRHLVASSRIIFRFSSSVVCLEDLPVHRNEHSTECIFPDGPLGCAVSY